MTDMEIPQAAVEAAAMAMFGEEQCDKRQMAALEENWHARLDDKDHAEYRALAAASLAAALPHLLTEVKSMCETAGEFGRAIGRKEALERAVVEIEAASAGMYYGDQHVLHEAVEVIRNMASQPAGYGSNGLTASSRHPGTPEDTKPPQEAL